MVPVEQLPLRRAIDGQDVGAQRGADVVGDLGRAKAEAEPLEVDQAHL